MNKKYIMIFILLIFIIIFSIFSTVAFITMKIDAKNIITFGSLKMELIETTLNQDNTETKIENDDIIDITNISDLSRIIKVKNIGKHDFFTRVSLNLIGIDKDNVEFSATKYINYDVNSTEWIYKDGWYYYNKIVTRDEITTGLLTNIKFDVNSITSDYPNGKFKLDIKAETVQAENNSKDVLEAMGWPSK